LGYLYFPAAGFFLPPTGGED